MHSDFKLFMVLLGCTPKGRYTEQHDVFFGIGKDLKSMVPDMIDFWPEAKGKIHIDAWQEVTQVGNFEVKIVAQQDKTELCSERIFFLNLGGYQKNVFEELHYKFLLAVSSKAEAIKAAKQTDFYKQMSFGKAGLSHIDDHYGVDVDDVFDIEDVLSEKMKAMYAIQLHKTTTLKTDEMNLGYLPIHKLI